MHELAVARQLIGTVEAEARKAGAERVVAVHLLLGERSHVTVEALQSYFELLAPATGRSHGAQLRITRVPMRFECRSCHYGYPVRASDFRCPRCRASGRLIDAGDGLIVESLEVTG